MPVSNVPAHKQIGGGATLGSSRPDAEKGIGDFHRHDRRVAGGYAALSGSGAIGEWLQARRLSIDRLIDENYAYLDRFPDGRAPITAKLESEASAVQDSSSLLRYAERRLALLADPHAITGRSFSDSWAIVPSYSDLWIDADGDEYRVTAVHAHSPALIAGVTVGHKLTRIGDVSCRTD